MIATNGKKACVIMDGDKVVTKVLVLQPVYELEGDLLLKFAVDIKKGTTLFLLDNSTEATANDDYKAGDYLYFEKGTFQPTWMLFYTYATRCNYYSEVRFLKGFDTSKLTSMYNLFYNCTNLTKVDASNIDTSNVTSMENLCRACTSLTSLDVSGWNTSKVTNMNLMFSSCGKLTSLDLSSFDTSKVTSMNAMFGYCASLTNVEVSGFDTSKVTNMYGMFNTCSKLTSLDLSKWNTSKVTNMGYMFNTCSKLTSLDASGWNTSNVTSMFYMFSRCYLLTNLIFGPMFGAQTSTAAEALTLDLSALGSSKSYTLTDETYASMLTMYDRATNGLTTMTIKFSKKHNLPDGFAEKMSALGYTITLV